MAEDKIDVLGKKVDGLVSEVRSNTYRMDKVDDGLDKLEATIDSRFTVLGDEIQNLTLAVHELAATVGTMSKQFAAVTSKVIEHDKRFDSVESRVEVLETR